MNTFILYKGGTLLFKGFLFVMLPETCNIAFLTTIHVNILEKVASDLAVHMAGDFSRNMCSNLNCHIT